MKKLLRKLFYRDSPAEGAVFSPLLFWLGSWCLASLLFLLPESVFTIENVIMLLGYGCWSFHWTDLLLVAAPALLLYDLFVTGAFYYRCFRERRGSGGLVLGALFLTALAAFLLLLPFGVVRNMLNMAWCCDPHEPWLFLSPFWGWAAVIFGLLCQACRFMAYAALAGKPLLTLFGKGAAVICGVFLLTCAVTLGMAYSAHRRTERHVAELEKFFGRPVTAQGLKALYFQGRRPDAVFWRKAEKLFDNTFPHLPNDPGDRLRCLSYPECEFSPAEFVFCRKEFEKSSEMRELEKMFSSPLPAYDRKFAPGFLFAEEMPDLQRLRNFCLYESWRVRFALADGDPAAAPTAVMRMKFCRDHLARDPGLVAALVLCAVENFRLNALERLLSSGLLTDNQLRELRTQLTDCREEMKKIHAQAVYGEAVQSMDLCHLIAHGGKGRHENTEQVIPGAYSWRWLLPACWYACTRNREVLAKVYKGTAFSRLKPRLKRSLHNYLGSMLLPSCETAGARIDALSARYLAMETLIGVELEKRRTGKYPDVLKDPPGDIFGEPLVYRTGQIPCIRQLWNAKKNDPDARKVMVDAVAVWSKGPDRKDDLGLFEGWYKRPDDIRALILRRPARYIEPQSSGK